MEILEELLNRRWIIKQEKKELYYAVRDFGEEVRKFVTEKLGFQLLVNSRMVKLEKIPARAENWMGIDEFGDKLEYTFLCMVLMFLEDKEEQEQFVLSQLTEYIAVNIPEERVDWTSYTCRRHLIKVLRFCAYNGIIRVNDGSDEAFAGDFEGEVLYENSGISNYFMRNFSRDIMSFQSIEDFEKSDWLYVNEDRGIARRQRVYNKLILSVGIYRETQADEEFEYLKRYGQRIQQDFNKYFECELQIHRSGAYLIMGDNSGVGRSIPENNGLSDIVLLCNGLITGKVKEGYYQLSANEEIRLSMLEFEQIVLECKERYGPGFIKTYRDKSGGELYKEVLEYMENLEFIYRDNLHQELIIRPVAGKVVGIYPKKFADDIQEEKD